jgi:PAS domain S-box-containing protein
VREWVGTCIDITERKKAEATLVESERRYRSLFANMNSGFAFCKIVSDNDGKPIDYVILEVNDDFEKLTRLRKEAVLGKRVSEVFFSIEKDPADWIGIYGRVATTGEPARFESYFELLKKWFSVAAYRPEIGYFAMAFDDITEHKKAEEVLLESEERLKRSQEIAHLGSWELDLTNNQLTWSDEVYRIFGLKPQEFGATYEAFLDAVHPDDRAAVDTAYSGSLREGRDTYEIEHRVVRKSTGEIRIVYEKCNHIRDGSGRIIRSVGMVHDITERKKAEESLEKEQQELNRIIDSSPIIIFYKDKEGKFIRVNEAFAEALKIPKEKFLGKTVFHLYSAEMARGMANDDLEVLKSGRPKLGIIEQYESASGMRWVQTDKVPILDKNGISAGLVGFALDITERKKAERELVDTLEASHRRQAEVSALLEASKAVLVHREFSKAARSIFDSCKDLLGATAGYVALLSRDKRENEVLFLDSGGLPCVVDPSLPMPIRGLRAEAYSTGKVVYCNAFPSSEWASLMPQGHVVLKNVLFAPLTIDDNTVGIIGLANKTGDFTERDAQMALAFGEIASVALINSQMLEKLEENEKLLKAHSERLEEMVEEKTKLLRDSERLAAIGQTAGMVGHDIRNPLQAIIGDVYLAKSDVASMPEGEKKESLQESLDGVEKNVQYISKIVADLQDYARPMKPFAQTINLENVIKDLLLKNDIPKGIKVSCSVENDCKQIVTDPDLLKRALGNLLTNAVQAMPEGGELDVHAFRDTNDNVITVADTGVGIPEQAKGNLFTPLFTTKSKGQGFGLAVVKRITEAMGGTVTFESQEGKGSKFTLRLPQKT